jgi:hypothetical protein
LNDVKKIESEHFFYLGLAILGVVVLALIFGQRLSNISLGPLDVGFADNTAPTNTPAPPTEPPIDQDDPGAPTITHTPEATLNNGRSTSTTAPTDAPVETPIAAPTDMDTPTHTAAPTDTIVPATAPTIEEGIRNPSEPVPAGTSVLSDALALGVDPNFELLQASEGKPTVQIAVSITVENRSDQTQLFTFTRSAISLKDDLGNVYDYASGKQPDLNAVQQVQIAASETLMWSGALIFNPLDTASLPAFAGPVNPGASQLILSLEGFGPYNGVEIFIDL